MDMRDVSDMANALIRQHNLVGWRFAFDGAKRRTGQCNYTTQTISMSRHLIVKMTEGQVKNTLLHEIAHALVGGAAGHGPEWRRVAISIGCDGNRCTNVEPAPYNWYGVCPDGHIASKRYRRPKNGGERSCAICNPKFSRDHLIKWVPAKEI